VRLEVLIELLLHLIRPISEQPSLHQRTRVNINRIAELTEMNSQVTHPSAESGGVVMSGTDISRREFVGLGAAS